MNGLFGKEILVGFDNIAIPMRTSLLAQIVFMLLLIRTNANDGDEALIKPWKNIAVSLKAIISRRWEEDCIVVWSVRRIENILLSNRECLQVVVLYGRVVVSVWRELAGWHHLLPPSANQHLLPKILLLFCA